MGTNEQNALIDRIRDRYQLARDVVHPNPGAPAPQRIIAGVNESHLVHATVSDEGTWFVRLVPLTAIIHVLVAGHHGVTQSVIVRTALDDYGATDASGNPTALSLPSGFDPTWLLPGLP